MQDFQFEFLKLGAPPAMEAMAATGIPASITLAQAILESNWGKSALAREGNNFFGVKAAQHAEHYCELPTTEGCGEKIKAKFAWYPSALESFHHHALLISAAQRYKPAMAVRYDPEAFAHALQACGYSTLVDANKKPIYGDRLMELVRLYNLTQYDHQPPDPAAEKAQAQAA